MKIKVARRVSLVSLDLDLNLHEGYFRNEVYKKAGLAFNHNYV